MLTKARESAYLTTGEMNKETKGQPVNLVNEGGELFMSFPSVYSCAKYLGVNKYRVNQSLDLNKSIVFKDQIYYVKKNVNQIT